MFSEPRERVRALGLFTAVSVGGGALGLIMGGLLTEWASWRWVMFVNVPIGLAVILVGLAVLPETQRHRGTFDLPGAVFSTLGMAGLVYGFVRAASDGWTDALTLSSFVGRRGPAHRVRPHRAARRAAHHPAAAVQRPQPHRSPTWPEGCCSAGMFGLFFFLTQFLQDVLGYSALEDRIRLPAAAGHRVPGLAADQPGADPPGARQGAHGGRRGARHHRLRARQRPRPLVVVRARARQPAAVRRRQRPGVRAAHPGGAGRVSRPRTPAPPPGWSTSPSSSAAPSAWPSW